MKIAQISDTHIGITTEGQLKVMLKALAKEEFDVLVHCGDYGGTKNGAPCVKRTVEMIRQYFPDKIFLSTIGNHDYWSVGRNKSTSSDTFVKNLEAIAETFKQHNVHFLDKDGIYQYENFVFIGSSGWYSNSRPPTNDHYFLPNGFEGDTNRYILKTTEDDLFRGVDQLEALNKDSWTDLIFVSHFPVVNTGKDYKGAFEEFSWRASLSDHFIAEYDCKHFLCGHAHQLHKGPLRYECGPDYYNPKYQIIEV